jgi:hypothetical protein
MTATSRLRQLASVSKDVTGIDVAGQFTKLQRVEEQENAEKKTATTSPPMKIKTISIGRHHARETFRNSGASASIGMKRTLKFGGLGSQAVIR